MSRTSHRTAAFQAVLLAATLICTRQPASAQVLYGSLFGAVTDEAGAAIPGAKVRITSTQTSQTREVLTDEAGLYSFTTLPGGPYDLLITKEQFRSYTLRGVSVAADTRVRADAVLKVGAVEQSIEVSALMTAVLQTDSAEVRSQIGPQTLENLPIPVGRNYQNLLITVPGITPPANQHSVAANPSRGLTFNVNGSTRNSNNVRIDGALANNIWLPHVTAYVPALDSIQEVTVVTATSDAQQGAGGSAVNVQIKSGTNQIHGSIFEFHANNRLKARPFFLPTNQGKPKFIDNQFGGSIGGPIVHNKLFYFGSWEGTYNRQTGSTFATVPTTAIRGGDLSGSANPIYDPTSGTPDGSARTPFAGNQIPQSSIDPIARKIAAAYPQPTFPNLLTNNYYATGAYSVDRPKLDGKVNYVVTDKLNVSGRIGWLHYNMNNPPVFGDGGGPPVSSAGGRAGNAFGDVYSTTYSANYAVRPSFIVDSYFGYTKSSTKHNPVRSDEKIGLETLGIPGTNAATIAGGWPDFIISSYADVGTPGGSSALRYDDSQWEYTANASWIKSSHTLRFGVDISKYSINHYEATSGMGVFNFTGGVTTLRGGPSPNQYNSYAQFLLGLTSSAVIESMPFDNNRITSRQKSVSFYAQDQWQAGRKLTVSLGVRWDYFPMGTRKTRGMERYDFNNNTMLICGAGNVPTDCGYNIEQKNFSPRVGLAYRPTSSLVIRAGYGLNYDPYPLAFVRNMLTNYPNDLLLTVNAPSAQVAATQLKAGVPAVTVPDLSSGRITVPATYAVRSLPDYVERGYIQSWNFSIQKQFWGGIVGQAAYVGSRQLKINQRFDLNAGQILGAGTAGQPYNAKFGRTTATELLTPVGHGTYDSLQMSAQRRLTKGLAVNMAYTWSKALGICCDDLSDSPPAIQIPSYLRLARSLMPYDRTHNFNTSFIAELPFGRGRSWATSGIASKIAGGWQLNGLISAYSGQPFNVTAAGTSLNVPGSTQRADLVKPSVQIIGGTGPNQSYFDPLAFASVTDVRFGTAGYGIVRGPGTFNFDGGLFREFHATERFKVQFRGEILNLTNTPHFSNPGANVSNLQLNADRTVRDLGGFSVITSTTGLGREGIDERMFRLGLRITF